MGESKRKYQRINPEEAPPPIIYDSAGKIIDRSSYDAWYYRKKRGYTRKTHEEKQAYRKKRSREYWVNYCMLNGLDPETWEQVRKTVLDEKKQRKQYWNQRKAYSRRSYGKKWW